MKFVTFFPCIVVAMAAGWISLAGAEPATTQASSRFQIRLVTADNDSNGEALPFFDGSAGTVRVSRQLELTDADLESARDSTQSNGRAVEVTFTDEGSDRFAEFTKSHINERAAIIFDGKVLCAPYIRSVIRHMARLDLGEHATRADADQLANTINQMIDNRAPTSQPSSR
jgi:preprotein translocase subunit SecD